CGTFGKGVCSGLGEELVCPAELLTPVYAAVLSPQPLAIQEVSAAKLNAHGGSAQACDRLDVRLLCFRAFAHQGSAACLESHDTIGPGQDQCSELAQSCAG